MFSYILLNRLLVKAFVENGVDHHKVCWKSKLAPLKYSYKHTNRSSLKEQLPKQGLTDFLIESTNIYGCIL